MEAVRHYWPAYEWATSKVPVPTAVLAAIHYKECGLREGFYSSKYKRVIRNRGGPFMMDKGGGGSVEFGHHIRLEEHRVAARFGISPVSRVDRDFRFAALCAAVEFQRKARGDLDREWYLADALWGYNGRAGWHRDARGRRTWVASPYVNNHPQRGRRMETRLTLSDGTVSKWLDSNPGALVIYAEIVRRVTMNPR